MTDVTKEAAAVANGAAKKNRRGISNNTVAAAVLNFMRKMLVQLMVYLWLILIL